MTHARLFTYAALAAVLLLGVRPAQAQGQTTPGQVVQGKPKIVITTDFVPHGMHAGLHLAKHKGWFDQAGLDVTVEDGKGSAATIQQLAASQIDIGFAQLSAMAAAISNGLPVISVMGFVRAGDNGLMVPVESGWKTLKDIKGKRVAVPAGSATAALFDAFLKGGGMTRDDVTVVNLDSAALASVYASGGADAALTTVAYLAPIVADRRPSSAILFSSYGLNVPGYGLVVRAADLDSRAAVFKAFVGAQQKTWDYIFAGHEDEAIDAMLAERAGNRLDRTVMMGQLKMYMPLFTTEATKGKPLGWQAETDWESALAAMKNVGLVKPEIKPADVYTNRFIAMN